MNNKGFASPLMLLFFLICLMFLAGVYWYSNLLLTHPKTLISNLITQPSPTLTPASGLSVTGKTYVNSVNGYSINLVPEATVSYEFENPDKTSVLASYIFISLPGIQDPNIIKVWKNLGIFVDNVKSRDQWCEELTKSYDIGQIGCFPSSSSLKYEEITINGNKAFKAVGSNVGTEAYYIPHNNFVFQIVLNTGSDQRPDQMLSTLKFIN